MRDWQDPIERRADVLGGEPIIRGTRVPARAIVSALAGGMSTEDVCASYRVREDDVRAALSFAASVLGEERALGTTLPAA